MNQKLLPLRLTVISCCAFLSVFLFSFSCEDHVVPENPQQQLPVIQTLNTVQTNADPSFSYSVQFLSLGNVPVTEYGVVTYAGTANENVTPAVPVLDDLKGKKYAFSDAGYMPPNLSAKSILKQYEGPAGNIRLFYRAYAILNNNSVVYGDVKFIDFSTGESNTIKPVIKTLTANKPQGSEAISYSLQFETIGNYQITEYGIVIYNGKQNEEQSPEVPTDSPLEKKFAYTNTPDLSVKSFIKFYDGPENEPVRHFYRAYVMLGTGDVVYGDIKFFDFDTTVKPVITTINATVEPFNKDAKVQFKVQFAELGTIPIYEFGIVYADGKSNESKIPDFPLGDGEGLFLVYSDPYKAGKNIINLETAYFVEPIFQGVFYRAFVKLNDGQIIYGGTKFLDFNMP